MAQRTELVLFSETEYEHKATDRYPVSCPTLDLSAAWDETARNLLIYRPPNQIVSKIHQVGPPGEKAPEAVAVTWKPDGQFLAVGWSDGYVRLMGLENNKAAHHVKVCENRDNRITHIGWTCNRIDRKLSRTTPKAQTIREGLSKEGLLGGGNASVDLPRELTFLEVETALPKITPLPSGSAGGGEDAMVFTLRSGIDFLFQPLKTEEYDQVNVMIVGTSDGRLQLSIYDSFVIGTFECPKSASPTVSRLVYHTAHPQISTHALLLADKSAEPEEVQLVAMDLPFISSSPINLSLLSSKLTTLQKLLRYIKQTQLHMLVEWKNTRELPTRFLRSVQGDLEEAITGPRSIVAALYHTVLTGHAHAPVREWLVESLAERGHKRWDKAVVAGLENLRSLVHENFLPALDRCSIILSRLWGLAQFHDNRDDIGFSARQISRLMDMINCLNLVGNRILVDTMDELDHFTAFSTWLRFQIDRLASSTLSDELTEKEATMDHGKVLTYIKHFLTNSPLQKYFDEVAKQDRDEALAHMEDGPPNLLEVLDSQLKKYESGKPSMKALPHADFWVDYATSSSNRVFKGIAGAKKRSVRFGPPIKLSLGGPVTRMDMRMCKTATSPNVFTALTSKGMDSEVHLFCTGLDIVNGISTNLPTTAVRIDLQPHKLIDFKFLNDETLLILCSDSDNVPRVLSIPTQPNKLSYGAYDPSKPDRVPVVDAGGFSVYTFPGAPTLRPVGMQVHEKADVRGEIPARICLLESSKTTLRNFAIP